MTFQAYQAVQVCDPNHERAGEAGHVVDANEVDGAVAVEFDADRITVAVPVVALRALI